MPRVHVQVRGGVETDGRCRSPERAAVFVHARSTTLHPCTTSASSAPAAAAWGPLHDLPPVYSGWAGSALRPGAALVSV